MALKPDSQKPMLPLALPDGHIRCADDANCRKPGRLWFYGMEKVDRVCISHAYERFARGEREEAPAR